ncbi:Bgt-51123 [Blumeria graminis f. sp. tritici]|uniref:Bgt-51123 n=1 Tax=Blumeria graminis f. sp. tritici TaxID=62690 RepID=A0A9X9PQD8_BLUGR|nr:Bgt-51123 [Blumeria graminis f. sp. tritici]
MKTRKEWAKAHLNWKYLDWTSILWRDEVWVEDRKHSRELVTRSTPQEQNVVCFGEKSKRVSGMFCGCSAGPFSGPCLFWEK